MVRLGLKAWCIRTPTFRGSVEVEGLPHLSRRERYTSSDCAVIPNRRIVSVAFNFPPRVWSWKRTGLTWGVEAIGYGQSNLACDRELLTVIPVAVHGPKLLTVIV